MTRERRIRNLKREIALHESEQQRIPKLTEIQPELASFPAFLENYTRQINERLDTCRKELAELEAS